MGHFKIFQPRHSRDKPRRHNQVNDLIQHGAVNEESLHGGLGARSGVSTSLGGGRKKAQLDSKVPIYDMLYIFKYGYIIFINK